MNYNADILIGIFVPNNKANEITKVSIDSATKDEEEEEEDIIKQKLIIRLMTIIF